VATYPDSGESALSLLEMADAAMYRGKRAGKNQVVAAGC
jgi:PleD family two-component response regulator